jgi:RNA-directed DNA polymerase
MDFQEEGSVVRDAGRPHNYPTLNGFYREVRRTWLRCLRRRSQKSRRMGWPEVETLTARFRLPTPRITRTWAQARNVGSS